MFCRFSVKMVNSKVIQIKNFAVQKLKLSIDALNTIKLYYRSALQMPKKLFMSRLRVKGIKITHILCQKRMVD